MLIVDKILILKDTWLNLAAFILLLLQLWTATSVYEIYLSE